MSESISREKYRESYRARDARNKEHGAELFQLKKDKDLFTKRFREIFAEQLMDLATDPIQSKTALNYLAEVSEDILSGKKVQKDSVVYETLVRLGQDVRMTPEEMDEIKKDFIA